MGAVIVKMETQLYVFEIPNAVTLNLSEQLFASHAQERSLQELPGLEIPIMR